VAEVRLELPAGNAGKDRLGQLEEAVRIELARDSEARSAVAGLERVGLGSAAPRFVGREPDSASSSRMIYGSSWRATRCGRGSSTFKT
jgi:hypothetical protein